MHVCACEGQRQLVQVGSLLPQCVSQGRNSNCPVKYLYWNSLTGRRQILTLTKCLLPGTSSSSSSMSSGFGALLSNTIKSLYEY